MQQLDLHGLTHSEATLAIEDFVLIQNLPVKIITGNSLPMQQIVKEIVKKHQLCWDYESHWNLGAIIVGELR